MGSIMKIKSKWNQEKINTTDNDLRELGGKKKKEHFWNQKKWRDKKNEKATTIEATKIQHSGNRRL